MVPIPKGQMSMAVLQLITDKVNAKGLQKSSLTPVYRAMSVDSNITLHTTTTQSKNSWFWRCAVIQQIHKLRRATLGPLEWS